MTHSEQINELAAALAAAQGEIENASKSSTNPHFKSKYADLAEVINCTRDVFPKNGLAVTQCPSYENGVVSVETVLLHKSGQWISSIISAPVSKQDAQGVGSAITYCRRYSLAAVAGIAQEDDDANGAVGHVNKVATTRKPVAAEAPEPPPFVSLADVTAEMKSAKTVEELSAIFASRQEMAKFHYSKGELQQFVAAKDEAKKWLTS